MIPKIIHQTWKNTQIPDNWIDAQKSCKAIHSDYKYILWTHEDMDKFVKNEYPNFYKTYISYKYNIQRCDAFRYLVLYKYGGIYIDLDIVCKKSLNNFLHYDIVLPLCSSDSNMFTNGFLMIIPKHPFFKYCIDQLPNYINSYSYLGKFSHVMNSTGPVFLTNMIKNYNKNSNMSIKNMNILTKKQFSGDCNVCNEDTCIGGEYFDHLVGKSWHDTLSAYIVFIQCNKEKIIGIIIGIIILIIVLYIYVFDNKKIKKKIIKK